MSISRHCMNTLYFSFSLALSLSLSRLSTLYGCMQCIRNLLWMFTGCFYTHMFTVYIFPGILRQIFLSYTYIHWMKSPEIKEIWLYIQYFLRTTRKLFFFTSLLLIILNETKYSTLLLICHTVSIHPNFYPTMPELFDKICWCLFRFCFLSILCVSVSSQSFQYITQFCFIFILFSYKNFILLAASLFSLT